MFPTRTSLTTDHRGANSGAAYERFRLSGHANHHSTRPGGFPMSTIAEWIRRVARRKPDALAYVDGTRRVTFSQFNDRVNRQVNGLYKLGLARGDRVAVFMNNHVEAIEAVAAAAKGGFV